MTLEQIINELIHPSKVHTRAEVLPRKSPVPRSPGVYSWFFKKVPPDVPIEDCVEYNGLHLLYVGISPKKPQRMGKPSKQNLRTRIKNHFQGNAEGSTLRLTLGCLLADKLGIELRRVGSGKCITFSQGEEVLSKWMSENSYVSWIVREEPWHIEDQAIRQLSLPLNLKGNERHPFHKTLTSIRRSMKRKARVKRILPK